jgi:hypothetical protein
MKVPLPKLSRETVIALLLFILLIVLILASAGPPRVLVYQGF